MIQKLYFICIHTFALLIFIVACWGIGFNLLRGFLQHLGSERWLGHGLAATFGLGVIIVLFQFLAIIGFFITYSILGVLLIGIALAIWNWRSFPSLSLSGMHRAWIGLLFQEKCILIVLLFTSLPPLVAPYRPPLAHKYLHKSPRKQA